MPRVLGLRSEATTLVYIWKSIGGSSQRFPDTDQFRALLPHGYETIGSGVSRLAVKSPNGYVYKLPFREFDGSANTNEIACIRALRNATLPEKFRLPGASMFTIDAIPVVVMEYIPNVADWECFSEDEDGSDIFKIFDWGPANCRRDTQGRMVPIDFGYSEYIEEDGGQN